MDAKLASSLPPIAHEIWDMKYRFKRPDGTALDATVEDTWRRVARTLAEVEAPGERARWEETYFQVMAGYRFLPAGRILAGAGTGRSVTLFNCFVMGTLADSMPGIFQGLKEAALTLQQGGGIGHDFSTLRPKGAPVAGVGADASGPLSFMDVWDAMCRTIMSAGSRRGAMMATLSCDHPDIEAFVEAKRDPQRLRNFNLSVLVTDAFMAALEADSDWPLVFAGVTFKVVKARALWDRIMHATYESAEPGVVFIDRINEANNLGYCETIHATNPCGEQPLPPYGACLLGSLNLASLVLDPFESEARLDVAELDRVVGIAVRMMDNVIEVSNYPLPEQEREAKAKRRIGLGVTGLADALAMCRLRYGAEAAAAQAQAWMAAVETAAYRASIALAKERGAFALFDRDAYLGNGHVRSLPEALRRDLAKHGIRNALLTSIAPTGTISLFAGNVSSGVEPIFAYRYERKVRLPDGSHRIEPVEDRAVALYYERFGRDADLPDYFVTAQTLTPSDHLRMQAALQAHVDSSISKTINCPTSINFDDFKAVYREAYDLGLKGCTTYRPNPITGAVLSTSDPAAMQYAQPALPLEAPLAVSDSSGEVVYMKQPLQRQTVLPGFTYKLKWPESDHAIYITINDIVQDGRRRPFEIFINSKNMEHYAWTVALTRMVSAVFRRGGDVSFVVEELKAVFDPRGGHWLEGRYVPSLLAAIGGIIERHMIDIGFISPREASDTDRTEHLQLALAAGAGEAARLSQCPKCGEAAIIYQEGCARCLACDYSKCG